MMGGGIAPSKVNIIPNYFFQINFTQLHSCILYNHCVGGQILHIYVLHFS